MFWVGLPAFFAPLRLGCSINRLKTCLSTVKKRSNFLCVLSRQLRLCTLLGAPASRRPASGNRFNLCFLRFSCEMTCVIREIRAIRGSCFGLGPRRSSRLCALVVQRFVFLNEAAVPKSLFPSFPSVNFRLLSRIWRFSRSKLCALCALSRQEIALHPIFVSPSPAASNSC